MLQAGPANARLTRFLFVAPYFCVTLPQQSHCLPKPRHREPRCDNTMPFASIWLGLGLALTSISGNHRFTLKNVCRTRHTTNEMHPGEPVILVVILNSKMNLIESIKKLFKGFFLALEGLDFLALFGILFTRIILQHHTADSNMIAAKDKV